MPSPKYEFRVADWTRFQHYKKRTDDGKPTRRPAWIKVYTKLLDDPTYLGLSAGQRALLHELWLWWARMDLDQRWSALDPKIFNRLLALNTKMSTWEALKNADFIEIRASNPCVDAEANARAEGEGEKETPTTSTSNAAGDDADAVVVWPDVPGWSRPSDVLAELLERRNG